MQKGIRIRMTQWLGLVGSYLAVGGGAMWLAFVLRFDGNIPLEQEQVLPWACPLAAVVQAMALILAGQASVVPGFFSLVDLRSVLLANAASVAAFFVGTLPLEVRIPRGVMVLDLLLLSVGVVGVRTVLRFWGERRRSMAAKEAAVVGVVDRAVAVVGAGAVGAALVREMLSKPGLHLKPVAFFDDDDSKWGQRLHGIPVVGAPDRLRSPEWCHRVRKVIIAMPSASASRLGEIARLCAELGISSDTMPALDQLVLGRVKVSQLRPVQIEDLLRRPAVELDQASIRGILRDGVVAVTGAGGSIGSELCRQILAQGPSTLLLIERCEVQLFQIEQELLGRGGRNSVVPLVADVTDAGRMRGILAMYKPRVVFHAAAHKHVPMMESQPAEAIRNNSIGTATLARAACEAGVERFVLISTDKAINPTNVMGASKRLAEVFLQAFHAANPGATRFMAVRFGNVLGSSGSVVPLFQRQIASGGPVTVTHPDVTRYFMTIPEAVGLVLQAGAIGTGGEIFVLDMGDPVKIVDLAKQMIELSGYKADEDIEIQFTGLRPGEKMFEELSHHREQLRETGHPKIQRFVSEPLALGVVEGFLGGLGPVLETEDSKEIKRRLQQVVPEYQPYLK